MSQQPHPPSDAASFHTTRWTRVGLAKTESEDGRRALADLCDAYYEPVVAFLRWELRDADAAREMSHAFFAEMLAGGTIAAAERERGRFRTYLLGAVKHFLANQREAARRMKRGGGAAHVSLNEDASGVCEIPDSRQMTPDAAFDREWALTTLARAMDAVKQECVKEGREAFFQRVKPWLTGDATHGDQGAAAEACGMSAAALKMAISRLRRRFRECVKEEIAGTLDDAAMVEAEMRELFAALAG
ncbi:MAG TPA: RNA polymerase subunit sigma-24 [Verrucomicrobiales bacterium]|nr:RNA polymerase subunit sigma-24 [Verrucomicrobiales bacterium]HRJ08412.1 sigma-70 family RNA polymerase sigma factor [Prosthecobacter sp.]HRK15133.1 sigma-70 family RNA polymerase sigma factor [Prosthecobacter sp.]